MNKKELRRYSLNVPEEEYNSRELRAALWRVLDVARAECGFTTAGERLLVQIYSSEGGCEIFVTKLGRLGQSAERNIARSGSVTMLTSKSTLYKFTDLSDLLYAMRHIAPDLRDRFFDAYLGEEGFCYLHVDERTGAIPISELSILSEFGTEIPTVMLTHLSEHATRIPPDSLFSVIS